MDQAFLRISSTPAPVVRVTLEAGISLESAKNFVALANSFLRSASEFSPHVASGTTLQIGRMVIFESARIKYRVVYVPQLDLKVTSLGVKLTLILLILKSSLMFRSIMKDPPVKGLGYTS